MSASALGRWPLIAGTLTLKCVGTLIMCPYMTGGRSRRGSPKAGTTVYSSLVVELQENVNLQVANNLS